MYDSELDGIDYKSKSFRSVNFSYKEEFVTGHTFENVI